MFLSSSTRLSNVEDEALLPFIRQRSLARFGITLIVVGSLACGSFLFSATPAGPAPAKKVVHRTGSAAKRAPIAKSLVKAKVPVKAATHSTAVKSTVRRTTVNQTAVTNQAL